jgi:hypothetical protein
MKNVNLDLKEVLLFLNILLRTTSFTYCVHCTSRVSNLDQTLNIRSPLHAPNLPLCSLSLIHREHAMFWKIASCVLPVELNTGPILLLLDPAPVNILFMSDTHPLPVLT